MRLHHRSQDDKINSIKRCFFEARHSRVALALERLRDLLDEFPGDPDVLYAEGLLRIDYLGQGATAEGLFQKTFQADNSRSAAAVNAVKFAANESEFSQWAHIARRAKLDDRTLDQFVTGVASALDSGVAYWEILARGGEQASAAGRYGESAALLELALLAEDMPPDQEASARRYRAQSLRTLDEEAHRYRVTLGEAFLPEERLALQEALSELEKALSLDEFDPELWNLKAAWCSLLGRYEEAIDAADRAIELRPFNYPRPHQNKAAALWSLGKYEEALECAREALSQAKSMGAPEDIDQTRKIVEDYSTPPQLMDWGGWEDCLASVFNAASIVSLEETGQWGGPFEQLVKGVLERASTVRSNRALDYVPIMAELLSDFIPETVLRIMQEVADKNPPLYGLCLNAALYIAAHSEGVRQRDAARFLSLVILGAESIPAIRGAYRQAVLEVSATATNEMSQLAEIMRAELRCISPELPQVIADQEPVDEGEKQRAVRNILSQFTGGAT